MWRSSYFTSPNLQELKRGSWRTQSRSSTWVAGAQFLEPSPLLPRVCISGELESGAGAGNGAHSDVWHGHPSGHLCSYAKHLCHHFNGANTRVTIIQHHQALYEEPRGKCGIACLAHLCVYVYITIYLSAFEFYLTSWVKLLLWDSYGACSLLISIAIWWYREF